MAVLVALGVVFTLGVGLGRALEEGELGHGRRTIVRTLEPATLLPERETVTVTVTSSG